MSKDQYKPQNPSMKSDDYSKKHFPAAEKESKDDSENKLDRHKASGYTSPTVATKKLPKTLDTSNADLKAALKKVNSSKDKTNFCLYGMADGTSGKLKVVDIGTNGWEGLRAVLADNQDSILFGVFTVAAIERGVGNDVVRSCMVYVSFVGSNMPEFVRAKANPLKNQAKALFGSIQLHLDIMGPQLDDHSPTTIAFKLLNAGGSHKPTHYDFSGKTGEIDVTKVSHEDEKSESEEDFD